MNINIAKYQSYHCLQKMFCLHRILMSQLDHQERCFVVGSLKLNPNNL